MSLKQRVGNFFMLFGLIGLLIFAASVIAPPGKYDIPAFLAGALLFGLGLNFRMSKPTAAPHAGPPAKAGAKGGPPGKGGPAKGGAGHGGGGGGGPKPGGGGPGGGPPKRQGLISGILKGPPPRKTAPASGPGGHGGPGGPGGPPRKK